MTPLLGRALGHAVDDRVASLNKFYEITAEENAFQFQTDYTKRCRDVEAIVHDVLASLVGSIKKHSHRFVTLFVQ